MDTPPSQVCPLRPWQNRFGRTSRVIGDPSKGTRWRRDEKGAGGREIKVEGEQQYEQESKRASFIRPLSDRSPLSSTPQFDFL